MERYEIKVDDRTEAGWDELPSTELEFENWDEVSSFAKNLSKVVKTQVRVNRYGFGQGHYFLDGRSL